MFFWLMDLVWKNWRLRKPPAWLLLKTNLTLPVRAIMAGLTEIVLHFVVNSKKTELLTRHEAN
jgi:hypothetical protein